jgi:dihydrofolate reductase
MQAPGGPNEDHEGGFRHGGWLVPYFDETFGEIMTEWTTRAGAFLLGRKTYEMFAASWPKSTDPADEIATALNTRPKFIASRTLDKVTWNNAHLLKGDVAKEVAKLRHSTQVTHRRLTTGCSGRSAARWHQTRPVDLRSEADSERTLRWRQVRR